jgi:hypothetical protein
VRMQSLIMRSKVDVVSVSPDISLSRRNGAHAGHVGVS